MVSTDDGNQKDGTEGSNGSVVKAPVPFGNEENTQRRFCDVFFDRAKFMKFGSASARLKQLALDRDDFSRSVSLSSEHGVEEKRNGVFSKKIDWPSLMNMSKEWIRNPMNMAFFVWIVCVAVSGAILFMVMVGMLNHVLPKKSQRDTWFEVNNQILNALFTLMCLYQHPKRFYYLVLLCRWKPEDISKLRKVYCKNGTYKPNEWAHMLVVVFLLHLNCFAQYALCGLNLGYKRTDRPPIGVGICLSVSFGAAAGAGIYNIVSPLGKDYDSDVDEEAQVQISPDESAEKSRVKQLERRYSFSSRDEHRIVETTPKWNGGIQDLWDDLSLAYASLFCSFCVFGWNMDRLGFGNMYVHIMTFLLFCFAPFWILNLAAVNIDNESVRSGLGVTGIILCVFGLLYGGFWRIQMRKRFNLPSYNFCFGKPAMSDCALWLFCCWCSLAQEVRTGNSYDIVENKFCIKAMDMESQLPMSPLPREDGPISGPSSPIGSYSSPSKTGIVSSPCPSRFSKEQYSSDLSSVNEKTRPSSNDETMTAPKPSLIQREAT